MGEVSHIEMKQEKSWDERKSVPCITSILSPGPRDPSTSPYEVRISSLDCLGPSNDIIAPLIAERYVLFFSQSIVCGNPQQGKPIQSTRWLSKIKGWECALCVHLEFMGLEKGLSKDLVWICQAQSSRGKQQYFSSKCGVRKIKAMLKLSEFKKSTDHGPSVLSIKL